MKKTNYFLFLFSLLSMLLLQNYSFAQTCQSCHSTEATLWSSSKHANTQADVASELSANWIGQTPDSVIVGSQAEDCISCHSPRAITSNGGMTETQAMGYFFSTTNGKYTDTTKAINTSNWPSVVCETCHESDMTTFGAFNSKTGTYDAVKTANDLCGNCHGTVRHPDTDHRIYDAWLSSKHGHKGQDDVAGELAGSHSGETPANVIAGEDCIACHAPTSVTLNGGMTEAQALGKFFSTTNGTFTSATVPADTVDYPNVSCITCHNPHDPDTLSYFNSSTKSYQVMSSSDQLCGQCHGNLRFPDTDHLSYNINSGTGGKNVSDITSMSGVKCIDCHMYNTGVDGSNSAMYKGHTWSAFVKEPDGSVDASCTKCHSTMSADSSMALVTIWKSDFQTLDSTAEAKVTQAASLLKTKADTSCYTEAQFNMTYAESDESGGVHNHLYSTALLNNAINNANTIINGALPVELTTFSADVDENSISLKWSTATETNNKGFGIQKSKDGINFLDAAFVSGFGTTTKTHNYTYVDKSVFSGANYYRLKQIDYTGQYKYSKVIEITYSLPLEFSLSQNFPNPFNPTTTIAYTVPKTSLVTIKVYDILGKEVADLVNRELTAGNYKIQFNENNLTSGIYFYELRAGNFSSIKKMILLK